MTKTPKILPMRHLLPKDRRTTPGSEHPTVDVLFQVFNRARVTGSILSETEIRIGQLLKFPPGRAYFQIVQDAPCQLHAIGEKRPLTLAPGDVVVLPHGQGHRIERSASSKDKKHPRTALAARVTTGVFEIEGIYGETLVRGLPRFLHVPGTAEQRAPPGGTAEWLPMTIAAMEQELRHPSIGSAIMLSRIADLLFIWAIRYWLTSAPRATQKGWIAALLDPAISHALSLLHADPGYDWTVSQLATHTSQSRSNFSRRFVESTGESPMRYLTNWRMQLASQLLSSSNQRVSEIAEEVGYASQAAFSRVFRRTLGSTPSEYRSQATSSQQARMVANQPRSYDR